MIELVIEAIRVNLRNDTRVVVLREKDADRYLLIWIGPNEAAAITVRLEDLAVPRPQTHDLLAKVIEELGATVQQVLVSDIDHDVYFAKVTLEANGKSIEVDSRPSDAIALAVRAEVPIHASDAVLEKAGIRLNAAGELDDGTEAESRTTPVTEEELERLSAFQDFISELDLDDLGEPEEKA